jgi:hypothetical protein
MADEFTIMQKLGWATWRPGVAAERGVATCDDVGTENRFQKAASGVRGV